MAVKGRLLTDEQWERVKKFIPERVRSLRGGRPPACDRDCFEGILWVCKSGARWRDLPDRYPSASTCWRRLQEWEDAGVFVEMWHAFIDELDERGHLDWQEVFVDGSFAPAKKGVPRSEKPNVERVQSGWWWLMAREFLWHVPLPVRRRRK
jgi:transposase